MNALHYIFYDAKRMYVDTSDMSAWGERAHRRLCDYIWWHNGPPANDDEILRQITHTEMAQWGRTKRELMGKGWVATESYFLHRGAIHSRNEATERYVSDCNRTAAANGRPRMELLPPHPETGVVEFRVTQDVTPNVTHGVTPAKTEFSKSEVVNRRRDYSLSNKLSLGGLGGIVSRILSNQDGWHYDNCKVERSEFTAAQLNTVLREFLERTPGARSVTAHQAVAAWLDAVRVAHGKAVDGTVKKSIGATCIDEWKRQLAAATQKQ